MDTIADEQHLAHSRLAGDRAAYGATVGGRNCNQRSRHVFLERRRRVAIERATAMHEGEPIAALGFVQIGGGCDNGDAGFAQPVEDTLEVPARYRVDTCRRFVEQQDLWRVHQRANDSEFLLHAAE
jgi:uncharacterized protein YneR